MVAIRPLGTLRANGATHDKLFMHRRV